MRRLVGVFWGICLMFMVAVLPVNAKDTEFTSFEELKNLAAENYDSYWRTTYQGEEELIIEEDLTIPDQLDIRFLKKVIIPEGVTLTIEGQATFKSGLELVGTLHIVGGGYTEVYEELIITGVLIYNGQVDISCPDHVTGIENMQKEEGGFVQFVYYEGSEAVVKRVAETAGNDNTPNTSYVIHIMDTGVVFDENISIPENMILMTCGVIITENSVVDFKGVLGLINMGAYTFEINGILNNNGSIIVYPGSDLHVSGNLNNVGEIRISEGGTMTVTEEGEYSGNGVIIISSYKEADIIATMVPGLDLTKFKITGSGNAWELRLKIDAFVARMYQQCLSRDPDQAGLDGWVGQLENGNMNGAQIAEQFVFSNEMLSKNLSDEEFVNVLYRAMMGREADEAGRAGWVNQLSNGYMTRSEVTKAFVESTEFTEICTSYGITRGTYDASIAPIEHFVTRFYTLCLERNADQAGLYGWVNNLKNQYMNGAQIADQFFFSDEFIARNVSDEKYIELLYNTLMGRPSDENGKTGWLGQLQNGNMTRRDMMKAFIESNEFTGICESYGITRGTVE